MAVDDPRGGRVQRRYTVEFWFHCASVCRAHAYDVRNAVGVSALSDAVELVNLRYVGGDDQLATAAVRYATLGAVGVKTLSAFHARARFD